MIKKFTLFILFAAIVFPQSILKDGYPLQRKDYTIVLRDRTKLDCTCFTPDTIKPAKGWPVIVYLHGYADDKYVVLPDAQDQAAFGYYTMCYSMRGQGRSTGLSNLISTTEMQDLMEVVANIKKDTLADSTRIALFGSSQGGILPFMAVCNGLNVRVCMSDLASPEFASSWIENGSIKTTLFFSVDYDTSLVRYDNEVKLIRKWILSKQEDKWDSIAYFLPRNRDYLNKVGENKVPVLLTNAWQDKFFNTLGMIKATSLLTAPYHAYFGAVDGHGADSTTGENNFISVLDNAVMEYYLNDIHHTLLDTTKYFYASSHYPSVNNQWSFTRQSTIVFPPVGDNYERVYLHPGGKLSLSANTSAVDTISLFNNVKDSTLTMLQAINYIFTGSTFKSKFEKSTLIFDSDSLRQDVQMTGTPKLHARYKSNVGVCQINAQIWEVKPNGQEKFVTRINYTDRHNPLNTLRDTLVYGISHSHIFRAGDRIRVVITNLDTQPADSFLTTNPHVLPVLKKSATLLMMDNTAGTYIELPILGSLSAITDYAAARPLQFELEQNYPNPFNPSTVITYSLANRDKISLKVYDVLGREVRTLADGMQEAGRHDANFNAANLASGIYIYRLTGSNFSVSKKCVLVK
ncbi:MAG: T9SS type A sorting domain-containing protein [Ignavibacteria bacterium]|nr:T9SS type A sorting domain-containing protein [Ignavibacteria bacterium]